MFYRTRTKNLKILIETKMTPNRQRNLEGKKMELEESDSLILDYTTKLQKSRQYDTGTKTEI